jgi:hypothetical protein
MWDSERREKLRSEIRERDRGKGENGDPQNR